MVLRGKCYFKGAIALFLTVVVAATAAPRLDGATLMRALTSPKNGEEYTLYIYVPENLGNFEYRYPVVYLLDGDTHFSGIQKRTAEKISEFKLPMLMIVGIGYGDGKNARKRDYTPTFLRGYEGSGGVRPFLDFVRREVVPYVDNNFRTVASPGGRCLAGHSLGGLTVLYAMLHHRDLFGKFISVSPALWWDGELFFKMNMNFSDISAKDPVRLHVSNGALEDPYMDASARRYIAILKGRAYGRLMVRYELIPEKNHDSVVIPALDEGIDFIFRRQRRGP